MEFLTDPVLLARIQFALTAMYHYVFVPLSIGLGLIVAIFETKYYRSQSAEDAAASRFWIKVFTATFALGVATGITMEFSFGTNWADYARSWVTSSVRHWRQKHCLPFSWNRYSLACFCSGARR